MWAAPLAMVEGMVVVLEAVMEVVELGGMGVVEVEVLEVVVVMKV